jgi:predicted nuclease of predicted toxin-antitoxin system
LKILLDENLPHQLRGHLPNHDVSTAVYVGFGGFTNGELLQAAEAAGF